MILLGAIGAAVCGAGFPLFTVIYGEAMDAIGEDDPDFLDTVYTMCYYFLALSGSPPSLISLQLRHFTSKKSVAIPRCCCGCKGCVRHQHLTRHSFCTRFPRHCLRLPQIFRDTSRSYYHIFLQTTQAGARQPVTDSCLPATSCPGCSTTRATPSLSTALQGTTPLAVGVPCLDVSLMLLISSLLNRRDQQHGLSGLSQGWAVDTATQRVLCGGHSIAPSLTVHSACGNAIPVPRAPAPLLARAFLPLSCTSASPGVSVLPVPSLSYPFAPSPPLPGLRPHPTAC